jgi:hypothetical protein
MSPPNTRDARVEAVGMAKAAAGSGFKRSLAVVVGIDDYQHGIPPLKTAANDARRLAHILERDYGYQVQLLVEDVTLERLKRELGTVEVEADDWVLFYFAGHSVVPRGDDVKRSTNLNLSLT